MGVKCKYVPEGGSDVDSTYGWVQSYSNMSWKGAPGDLFPFSGHGYTFDWQKWNHNGQSLESAVGLNEFVIPTGVNIDFVDWTSSQTPLEFFCEICEGQDCGNFTEWVKNTGACNGSDEGIRAHDLSHHPHPHHPHHSKDQCLGGSDALIPECRSVYEAATAQCADQETDPSALLSQDLIALDPSKVDSRISIVYLGEEKMAEKPSNAIDIWFTLEEQNLPYMREVASDLHYYSHSHHHHHRVPMNSDSVNRMLQLRAASVVGMADFDPDMEKDPSKTWFVNRGTTPVRQFNMSDGVGWDVAKQQLINREDNQGFFRPCFNSFDISNVKCEYVPEGGSDVESTYGWVQSYSNKSWKGAPGDLFPFSGHGYTFDWQKWNHDGQSLESAVGLNEFVIPTGVHTDVVDWTSSQTPLEFFCEICEGQDCGNFTKWAKDTRACGSTFTVDPILV